jgi:AraC-like DNA-binding protein
MRQSHFRILAGAKQQPAGYRFTTDRYDQFQIISIASGRLHLGNASGSSELPAGASAVLACGSAFELTSPRGYSGVFCIVTGTLPAAMHGASFAVKADAKIRCLAEMMLGELRQPCEDSTRLLESLGYTLAWRGVQCGSDRIPQRRPDAHWWASRAKAQIDANIYSSLGCREILASLARSYRQLSRDFQAVWEMSPKRYQLQAKAAEARRLLSAGTLSVTAIAMELGFSSSQHLATTFKSLYGLSPSSLGPG